MIKEKGLPIDVYCYTAVIDGAYENALHVLHPFSLCIPRLRSHLLNISLSTVIHVIACAKGKMWRRALELLDEMRLNDIAPNGVTYSVAIAACGNGGQYERALELLHQVGYCFESDVKCHGFVFLLPLTQLVCLLNGLTFR